jgi:hypothetical protein
MVDEGEEDEEDKEEEDEEEGEEEEGEEGEEEDKVKVPDFDWFDDVLIFDTSNYPHLLSSL